ncbi:MAG: hypothetical protein ACT4PV_13685 [Planctomycetaceae bacterium]
MNLFTPARLRTSALLLALCASASADVMEDRLEEKMQKEFVGNAAWITDYAAALEAAKAGNKLIFAYFTRSYSP